MTSPKCRTFIKICHLSTTTKSIFHCRLWPALTCALYIVLSSIDWMSCFHIMYTHGVKSLKVKKLCKTNIILLPQQNLFGRISEAVWKQIAAWKQMSYLFFIFFWFRRNDDITAAMQHAWECLVLFVTLQQTSQGSGCGGEIGSPRLFRNEFSNTNIRLLLDWHNSWGVEDGCQMFVLSWCTNVSLWFSCVW